MRVHAVSPHAWVTRVGDGDWGIRRIRFDMSELSLAWPIWGIDGQYFRIESA